MAPIVDASWRRSGSPDPSEQASKRFIYEKTDELFIKRQSTPTLITFSSTPTKAPDGKLRIQNSIGGKPVILDSDPGATASTLSNDTATTNSAPPPNIGLIVGAVVGGILALLIVFGCIFLVNRRSRKHREMQESTQPHPFTAQRPGAGGPVSIMSRDLESQKAPPTTMTTMNIGAPTAFRRGPSTAFASRFVAGTDRSTSTKARPPQLALKDPFVDPQPGAPVYDTVSLSPEKPSERIQTRNGPSNAAHNPFADPIARSQSVEPKTPASRGLGYPEPLKTPGSRGMNRGVGVGVGVGVVERVRGGEVNRSASTRTLTNTPKPVVGLPSRPKSAARLGFANDE